MAKFKTKVDMMYAPWMVGAYPWSISFERDTGLRVWCNACGSGCSGALSMNQAFNILSSACSCPQAVCMWRAIMLIRWLTRPDRQPVAHADGREIESCAPDNRDHRPAQQRKHNPYAEAPRPGSAEYDRLDRRNFKYRCLRYERFSGHMDPDAYEAWGIALAREGQMRARADRERVRRFFAPD